MNIHLLKIYRRLVVSIVLAATVLGVTHVFAARPATLGLLIGQPHFFSNAAGAAGVGGNFALTNPAGSTWDSSHQVLWVADTANNRVAGYETDTSGTPNDFYIDYVIGQDNLYSTGTGLSDHHLSGPTDISFDKNSLYLYIADSGNNRILVFDSSFYSQFGMSASFVIGQSDFTSNAVGTDQDKLSNPTALDINPYSGELYVVDAGNNRVLVFNTPSIDGENAINVIGQPDFITSGPSYVTNDITFNGANDVVFGRQDNGKERNATRPFTPPLKQQSPHRQYQYPRIHRINN